MTSRQIMEVENVRSLIIDKLIRPSMFGMLNKNRMSKGDDQCDNETDCITIANKQNNYSDTSIGNKIPIPTKLFTSMPNM